MSELLGMNVWLFLAACAVGCLCGEVVHRLVRRR